MASLRSYYAGRGIALSALGYWQLISGRCSRPRLKTAVGATNIPFPTVPFSLAVVYFISRFVCSCFVAETPVWLARRLA
jgi:hypothetical protein